MRPAIHESNDDDLVTNRSLGTVALSTASATATVSPPGHITVSVAVTPAAAAGSLALDAEASVPSGSFRSLRTRHCARRGNAGS